MGRVAPDPSDVAAQIAALERRIRALETSKTIPVVETNPTDTAPDGAQRLMPPSSRLWLRSGGTWKYVTLT